MTFMPHLIAMALTAYAPDGASLVPCLGAMIYFGHATELDVGSAETLDRFVAGRPLYRDGTRLAILVASPNYAGTTMNQRAVAARQQAIRDHLVRAGLPADRITVAEHGRYGRPPYATQAGIVLVETPPDSAGACAALGARRP